MINSHQQPQPTKSHSYFHLLISSQVISPKCYTSLPCQFGTKERKKEELSHDAKFTVVLVAKCLESVSNNVLDIVMQGLDLFQFHKQQHFRHSHTVLRLLQGPQTISY